MSNDAHHIADMILGNNNTNQQLENAVERGSRGVVKGIVNTFINKRFPALSGLTPLIDVVVDIIFDYFGW